MSSSAYLAMVASTLKAAGADMNDIEIAIQVYNATQNLSRSQQFISKKMQGDLEGLAKGYPLRWKGHGDTV